MFTIKAWDVISVMPLSRRTFTLLGAQNKYLPYQCLILTVKLLCIKINIQNLSFLIDFFCESFCVQFYSGEKFFFSFEKRMNRSFSYCSNVKSKKREIASAHSHTHMNTYAFIAASKQMSETRKCILMSSLFQASFSFIKNFVENKWERLVFKSFIE